MKVDGTVGINFGRRLEYFSQAADSFADGGEIYSARIQFLRRAKFKFPNDIPAGVRFLDFRSEALSGGRAAFARRMAGADLRERFVRRQDPFDQHLDAPARVLDAEDACAKHACVIEDDQIARREQ